MKKLFCVLTILVLSGVSAFCAQQGTTPVKLSLFPPISVPSYDTVHGLDFGLISSVVKETQGVQIGFIYLDSKERMYGYQHALISKTSKLAGFQTGLIDLADEVRGVQWGFFNQARRVGGLQLGFVNICDDMNGLQIGLVNIIRNSSLPFMIIANARFE